jgi:hypothetical protein
MMQKAKAKAGLVLSNRNRGMWEKSMWGIMTSKVWSANPCKVLASGTAQLLFRCHLASWKGESLIRIVSLSLGCFTRHDRATRLD